VGNYGRTNDVDEVVAELAEGVEWMETQGFECCDEVRMTFWGGHNGDDNVRVEQVMRKEADEDELQMPIARWHDGTPVET